MGGSRLELQVRSNSQMGVASFRRVPRTNRKHETLKVRVTRTGECLNQLMTDWLVGHWITDY